MNPRREPWFAGRRLAWMLALAGAAVAAAAILDSGRLMAQKDDEPTIPTAVRAAPGGRVVDPDGQPVPGARILLYHASSYWGLDNRVEEEVVSAGDGRFAFSNPLTFKNPAARQDPPNYTVIASAPGRAPAWAAVLPDLPADHVFTLTVTPPKTQTYEVVDNAGHPVEGATVWLRFAGKQPDRRPFFPENLSLPEDIGLCRALTDAAGRATLANLPDTQVSIAASNAGCEDDLSCITPPEGVPRFTLRPAAVLTGRVTDPLGKPVEGAVVSLYPKFRFHQYFLARTDAEGRYRVEKIWSDRAAHPDQPDWGRYTVAVRHARFTAATREVAFTLGQTITGFDLAAVPGTEVVIRLLDPATRAPVVGARVYVTSDSGRQERDTDGAGRARCRIVPGKFSAAFIGPPLGCYVVDGNDRRGRPDSVSTQAEGEQFAVEMFLSGPLGRLGTVRGHVERPNGGSVAFCLVTPVIDTPRLRLTGWTGSALRGVTADEQGRFELRDMPSGLPFTLAGQTSDGRWRGTLAGRLEADALDLSAPLVLRGTVAAEILLTDLLGQPRPNLAVAVDPIVAGKNVWTQRQDLHSGPDGVLRLASAVPGSSYEVSLPGPVLGSRSAQAVFTVPADGSAAPEPRPTLVVADQYLVRLLGSDGQPVGIKSFKDFHVDLHEEGRVVRWSNGPLAVDGRAGPDVLVSRRTLVLGKGNDVIHFLIETEAGALVRADGTVPADGTGRIVARVTGNL